jgi:hypothetical protein
LPATWQLSAVNAGATAAVETAAVHRFEAVVVAVKVDHFAVGAEAEDGRSAAVVKHGVRFLARCLAARSDR